jgi:four helix bundle protein
MYQSFTDLPVWKQALVLSSKIFELSSTLPRNEDYGLTSQIRRAANSIGASIAEGFGREHKKDKRLFYSYARSSALETIHHLKYGTLVGYFRETDVSVLITDIEKSIFELSKLIKMLDS